MVDSDREVDLELIRGECSCSILIVILRSRVHQPVPFPPTFLPSFIESKSKEIQHIRHLARKSQGNISWGDILRERCCRASIAQE